MSEERNKLRTWVDAHVIDTYQLAWMGRSIWKSTYFGLLIALVMVGAASISRQSLADIEILDKSLRIKIVGSFIFDNVSIYFTSAVAFALGITVSTWDASLVPIRRNLKQFINYGMVSIGFSMFMVFIWIEVGGLLGDLAAKNAYTTMTWINMIVACMFGLSQVWRSYIVYSVLDKKNRREFLKKRRDDSPIKSILKFFVPMMDKTRLTGGLVWAALITITSLSFSSLAGAYTQGTQFVSVAVFTLSLSLLSALLGVLIRLWNSLKPFGMKDTLYPHWELKQGFVKINSSLLDQ